MVIQALAASCLGAAAFHYAEVGCEFAEAEIDSVETEDLEGQQYTVVVVHSEIEGVHSGTAEEARFGIGEAHSGIVEGHFEIEVVRFGTEAVDHSEIGEEDRSEIEEVDHFEIEEVQSENLVGNSVPQETEIAEAVESLDCSGIEAVPAD